MDNQYKVSKIKKGILLYSGFKIFLGRVFLKFFFSTFGEGETWEESCISLI